MAWLLIKKIIVLTKYSDFADLFLKKPANVLSEQTAVNKYTIKFEKGKQPPYRPTYNLRLVELKTFKTYTKIYLANNFIWVLKLPAGTSILFDCKPNGSFRLCINYHGFNNLTIKN